MAGLAVTKNSILMVRTYGRVLVDPAAVEEYRAWSQPEGVPKRGRQRKLGGEADPIRALR